MKFFRHQRPHSQFISQVILLIEGNLCQVYQRINNDKVLDNRGKPLTGLKRTLLMRGKITLKSLNGGKEINKNVMKQRILCVVGILKIYIMFSNANHLFLISPLTSLASTALHSPYDAYGETYPPAEPFVTLYFSSSSRRSRAQWVGLQLTYTTTGASISSILFTSFACTLPLGGSVMMTSGLPCVAKNSSLQISIHRQQRKPFCPARSAPHFFCIFNCRLNHFHPYDLLAPLLTKCRCFRFRNKDHTLFPFR